MAIRKIRNIVKMNGFDVVLEMVDPSEHCHHDNDAGHPGEDGADDKIGTEDGAVPQGLDGHGKDKRDDGMDGDHDGNDEDRHEVDRLVQTGGAGSPSRSIPGTGCGRTILFFLPISLSRAISGIRAR